MPSPDFQQRVIDAATGSATPIISKGKWDMLLVPVPPVPEQIRIAARVAELRRHCSDLRQRLTASQTTQSHLAEALVDEVAYRAK
jgi:type I restriction enzyme S subunit